MYAKSLEALGFNDADSETPVFILPLDKNRKYINWSYKIINPELNIKPEECIAVGDGKSDECLFRACGLSLAYKPLTSIGDVNILNLAEVLIYAE